jgi:hypothetical protein
LSGFGTSTFDARPRRETEMSDRVKAWQCIGCGKIEAPQTCVGVCQDRKIDLVYASEHEEALAQLAVARTRIDTLEAIARQLARTTPRAGAWEGSYRALQERARKVLGASHASPRPSLP